MVDACVFELEAQALLVSQFQEAGAKLAMHLDGESDDFLRQQIDLGRFFHVGSLGASASLW